MVNIKTSILHTLNVKDGQRKAKEATHLHGRLYYTPTVVPIVSSNNSHNNNSFTTTLRNPIHSFVRKLLNHHVKSNSTAITLPYFLPLIGWV